MAEIDPYVVAIDGPGGSGKGSLALAVARKLGFHLLDSGAIYRLAALRALGLGIDLSKQADVVDVLEDMDIRFEFGDELSIPFLDDKDVSHAIRQESTGNAASIIAQYAKVRKQLLHRQRACFQPPGLVADGRDMGTVVFADAPLKIYLTASVSERAARRYKQLIAKGENVSLPRLLRDIEERDARDRSRQFSPLIPAEDAIVIDSSATPIADVFERVMHEAKKKGLI